MSISIHTKTLHHEPFAGRNGGGGGRYITSHTNKPSECVCVCGGGGGHLMQLAIISVLDKVPNTDQHISSGSMIWNFTVAHKKLKKIRLHITFSMEFVQRNMNQS